MTGFNPAIFMPGYDTQFNDRESQGPAHRLCLTSLQFLITWMLRQIRRVTRWERLPFSRKLLQPGSSLPRHRSIYKVIPKATASARYRQLPVCVVSFRVLVYYPH